jgi:hypothetical protein
MARPKTGAKFQVFQNCEGFWPPHHHPSFAPIKILYAPDDLNREIVRGFCESALPGLFHPPSRMVPFYLCGVLLT